MKAKIEATRLATIKAGKLPPVKLTEKQMASVNKLNGTTGRIVWLGAGGKRTVKSISATSSSQPIGRGRKS